MPLAQLFPWRIWCIAFINGVCSLFALLFHLFEKSLVFQPQRKYLVLRFHDDLLHHLTHLDVMWFLLLTFDFLLLCTLILFVLWQPLGCTLLFSVSAFFAQGFHSPENFIHHDASNVDVVTAEPSTTTFSMFGPLRQRPLRAHCDQLVSWLLLICHYALCCQLVFWRLQG